MYLTKNLSFRYVEDFEARIPREEMDQFNAFLIEKIKSMDEKFTITLCGSYRRGNYVKKNVFQFFSIS